MVSLAWQAGAVAVGAAAGALVRWAAGVWLNPVWPLLPLGTLAVNLGGGFAIGLLMAALPIQGGEAWRLLMVTGFLGGMTTFSAFSLETLQFLLRGQVSLAILHVLFHVLGALGCAAAGWWLGRCAWSG